MAIEQLFQLRKHSILICIFLLANFHFGLCMFKVRSYPFQPFRMECPSNSAVVKIDMEVVEPDEDDFAPDMDEDIQFNIYCDAVDAVFPRGFTEEELRDQPIEREVCRWTSAFPFHSGQLIFSNVCTGNEYLAGLSRIDVNDQLTSFLCCQIDGRPKTNCKTAQFPMPGEVLNLTRYEMELKGYIVTSLELSEDDKALRVRFCALENPRAREVEDGDIEIVPVLVPNINNEIEEDSKEASPEKENKKKNASKGKNRRKNKNESAREVKDEDEDDGNDEDETTHSIEKLKRLIALKRAREFLKVAQNNSSLENSTQINSEEEKPGDNKKTLKKNKNKKPDSDDLKLRRKENQKKSKKSSLEKLIDEINTKKAKEERLKKKNSTSHETDDELYIAGKEIIAKLETQVDAKPSKNKTFVEYDQLSSFEKFKKAVRRRLLLNRLANTGLLAEILDRTSEEDFYDSNSEFSEELSSDQDYEDIDLSELFPNLAASPNFRESARNPFKEVVFRNIPKSTTESPPTTRISVAIQNTPETFENFTGLTEIVTEFVTDGLTTELVPEEGTSEITEGITELVTEETDSDTIFVTEETDSDTTFVTDSGITEELKVSEFPEIDESDSDTPLVESNLDGQPFQITRFFRFNSSSNNSIVPVQVGATTNFTALTDSDRRKLEIVRKLFPDLELEQQDDAKLPKMGSEIQFSSRSQIGDAKQSKANSETKEEKLMDTESKEMDKTKNIKIVIKKSKLNKIKNQRNGQKQTNEKDVKEENISEDEDLKIPKSETVINFEIEEKLAEQEEIIGEMEEKLDNVDLEEMLMGDGNETLDESRDKIVDVLLVLTQRTQEEKLLAEQQEPAVPGCTLRNSLRHPQSDWFVACGDSDMVWTGPVRCPETHSCVLTSETRYRICCEKLSHRLKTLGA